MNTRTRFGNVAPSKKKRNPGNGCIIRYDWMQARKTNTRLPRDYTTRERDHGLNVDW